MASRPRLYESGMRCNKFDTVFQSLEKLELIWNFLLFLSFRRGTVTALRRKIMRNYELDIGLSVENCTNGLCAFIKFYDNAYGFIKRHDRQEKCTADDVIREDKRKLALTRWNREIQETIGRDTGKRSVFMRMTLLEASFLLPPSAVREW